MRIKRLLFDILVKLQRANVGCSPNLYLPPITLDDYDGDAGAELRAELDRRAAEMRAGLAKPD